MKKSILICGLLLAQISGVWAQNQLLTSKTEALFAPGRDLADIKLSVDQLIDPTVNIHAGIDVIDRIAKTIKDNLPPNAKSSDKLSALRRILYEPGDWNAHQPFHYDLSDPLGSNPSNRQLLRYLKTRQGNCITMPMLMLFVGQRLGLKMTLAEAPLHVFIKYTDDNDETWNLEATSGGGFTRDLWYKQKLPMSDQAVAHGIYLRALSHDEAAALIASSWVEYLLTSGRYEDAISVSDVLLRYYPNFAYVLVKKGSAYSALLHRELAGKYRTMIDIPPALKKQADDWYRQNQTAFAQAEALGWRPEDGQQ